MAYRTATSLEAFVKLLKRGDVLCYDTLSPQGGLIQFADRRNVSHTSMYVGGGFVVDASSKPPEQVPGEPPPTQRPIRRQLLSDQFPLPTDKGATDLVSSNRSLVALRHQAFAASPDLGKKAAAVADRMFQHQRPGDTGDTWKFTPNDLLVLTPLVLTRSLETAYAHAPFLKDKKLLSVIKNALRLVRIISDPAKTDYKPGVTCSELVHRILRDPKLGLTLKAGTDGRPPLQSYVDRVRKLLKSSKADPALKNYLKLLDWQGSPERRAMLADVPGVEIDAGNFDESDFITPGDIWAIEELVPFAGYTHPIRSADGKPC